MFKCFTGFCEWLRLWQDRRAVRHQIASVLFDAAMKQARAREFYVDLGVEDTLQGRFEMLALHLFMVQRGLHICASDTAIARQIADLSIKNIEDNLRAFGVSDMRIGDRMKTMAKSLYGRFQAYDAATRDGEMADEGIWRRALARNIYRTDDEHNAAALAAYCVLQWPHFVAQLQKLLAGNMSGQLFMEVRHV